MKTQNIGPFRVECELDEGDRGVGIALQVLAENLGQEQKLPTLPEGAEEWDLGEVIGGYDYRFSPEGIRRSVREFVRRVQEFRAHLLGQNIPAKEGEKGECLCIYDPRDLRSIQLRYFCHHGKEGERG